MAQAATDLPETPEQSTADPADADELLSQLAGSEIDRLLAEADVKPNTPHPEPEPQTTAHAPPEGPERAALLDAAGFDPPNAAPAAEAQEAEGDSQDPIQDAPAAGAERSAVLHAAGFQPGDAASDLAAEFDQALDAIPAVIAPAPNPSPEDETETESVPLYLKPLVWINAPLDACPAGVRMVMGKAAIITLVNALAVLAYVMFFRKH